MASIEKYSVIGISIAQVRYEWKVRLHYNLIVDVGVQYFGQGPFRLLTNCQNDEFWLKFKLGWSF